MLDLGGALVFQKYPRQVFAIDPGAILRILQPQVGLSEHALAGAADGHDRQTHPLGLGNGARVDRVGDVLGQNAGAGAGDVLHFLQFDAEFGRDPDRGGIQFGTSALGNTSGIKRVLHFSFASALSRAMALAAVGSSFISPETLVSPSLSIASRPSSSHPLRLTEAAKLR